MTRRKADSEAVDDIGDARQLLWHVAHDLRGKPPAREYVRDLEAADVCLARAAARFTRPRSLFWSVEGVLMPAENLKLVGQDALSSPRAEIIGRAWQVVAILQDVRNDLMKQVRESEARNRAVVAFDQALTQIVLASTFLVPPALADHPQLARTDLHMEHSER